MTTENQPRLISNLAGKIGNVLPKDLTPKKRALIIATMCNIVEQEAKLFAIAELKKLRRDSYYFFEDTDQAIKNLE